MKLPDMIPSAEERFVAAEDEAGRNADAGSDFTAEFDWRMQNEIERAYLDGARAREAQIMEMLRNPSGELNNLIALCIERTRPLSMYGLGWGLDETAKETLRAVADAIESAPETPGR